MVTFAQFSFYLAFHWLVRFVFRPKIIEIEHIPNRPFILVANHTSKLDPFLLSVLPFSAIKRLVPIYFLTTEYYYKRWYLCPILSILGSYPVSQRAWTLDEFLFSTIQKLKNGKVVMFFPEGKITDADEKLKPKPGIGYLTNQTQIPILPLHIKWGNDNHVFRKKLTLAFGKPILSTVSDGSKISYENTAQIVMKIIYSL